MRLYDYLAICPLVLRPVALFGLRRGHLDVQQCHLKVEVPRQKRCDRSHLSLSDIDSNNQFGQYRWNVFFEFRSNRHCNAIAKI